MSNRAFPELVAPAAWRTVEFVSDLHLQPDMPSTLAAWRRYLRETSADALFVLGDLFEVWVGDDATAQPGFEADCAHDLHAAARRLPIFLMHGNRDFLVGEAFARQTGVTLLHDPTVLVFASARRLLSHGDALCLDDVDYQRFRAQVRDPAWQQALLTQPLEARRTFARSVRTQSQARQRDPAMSWADVDTGAARAWLRQANAPMMIHGHTHRPADHDLGDGLRRIVLSDWDLDTRPPRAQVLRLSATGVWRVDLS